MRKVLYFAISSRYNYIIIHTSWCENNFVNYFKDFYLRVIRNSNFIQFNEILAASFLLFDNTRTNKH